MSYYTIGIAGHIDHGKTTLTKALTDVDTDRLKEEKERNISIELGYAPIHLKKDYQVSIIDVPGHEKFIKQMIAGVTGIDLVIVAIAADEGIMPQTKEHFEILSLLGIEKAIIAITKAETVDNEQLELAKEEIKDYLHETVFNTAEVIYVDGISKRGITELKLEIVKNLEQLPQKDIDGAFRLPIDQVFTLQGHGTIIRGTIYDGMITTGQPILILPDGYQAKIRQLQSQNQVVSQAYAGQRVAINISGVARDKLQRGHVLVDSNHYATTNCIDIVMRTTVLMRHSLKQRELVKLHIGTSEVMGKLVFFDRNVLEAHANEAVYCQIRLEEPIVGKKGDRFILRRPSPMETFAGGKIINVSGEKYPFGKETVEKLKQMEKDSPLEQLMTLLRRHKQLTPEEMIKQLGVTEEGLHRLLEEGELTNKITRLEGHFISRDVVAQLENDIFTQAAQYHEQHPLRTGIPKAEVVQTLKHLYPEKLINAVLEQMKSQGLVCLSGPSVFLKTFQPSMPKQWEKKMLSVINQIESQGLEPMPFKEIITQTNMPDALAKDFLDFIIREKIVERLDEKHLIHHTIVNELISLLKRKHKESFTLQEAKSTLNTSRKFLVLFLELLDLKKVTVRDDNKRRWVHSPVKSLSQ
ncbi:selenocysteine-specific translation elongation factor [Bacillus sp. PK3_68]|uniref:selenocysteine-specific translation elongation factor n=1 Tax=Bacillus sp. PK3_68 TaxID=2027408 RepID=UPI0016020333|nr:selenocysteine-specific translation elongation factor [Bacillus sp. PK3_68]